MVTSDRNRRLAPAGLLALIASSIWIALFLIGPRIPPPHSDAWDYLQLGRSIAEGSGFQSDFTYPILLSLDDQPPFPTLWRLPLYPLVVSIPFLVWEDPPLEAALGIGGLFHVLSGILFYLWLTRLLPIAWAFWGGIVWILNPHLLDSSLQGLSEPFYLCLCIGLFWILSEKGLSRPILLGVWIGLCWITRSNTLLFLPGVLLWGWMESPTPRGALRRLVGIGVTVGLVCLPWWIRNSLVVGDPFFNMSRFLPLMFSTDWPGWTLFRTDFPSLAEVPPVDPVRVIDSGISHLWSFGIRQRLLSGNPVLLLLALYGVVASWRNRGLRPALWLLAVFFLASDLITVAFLCAVEPVIRLYLPVMPLATVFALLGLYSLSGAERGRGRFVLVACLLALSVFLYAARFAAGLEREPWRTLSPESVEEWKEKIPAGAVILSDTADYLAWRLDRTTVFMPTLDSLSPTLGRWEGRVFLHFSPEFEPFAASEGESAEGWRKWTEGEPQSHLGAAAGHRLLRPGL